MSVGVGELLVGRYRLVEEIATGGMGKVWRAYDETLCRAVAAKEVKTWVGMSEREQQDAFARIKREAKNAAKFQHPNIAAVYDIVQTEDDRPWIIMEMVEWSTLHELVERNGRLTVERVKLLATQLFSVLHQLHGAGVLHRDLKARNILVGPEGDIKLIDFGIAMSNDDDASITAPGLLIGTAHYMAPEFFAPGQASKPTPATDLWAAGIVLYLAAMGRLPFNAEFMQETIAQIVTQEPELGNVPDALRRLITGLLEKDPSRRLTLRQAEAEVAQVDRLVASAKSLLPPRDEPTVRSVYHLQPTRKLPVFRPLPYLLDDDDPEEPSFAETSGRRMLVGICSMLVVVAALLSLAAWAGRRERASPVAICGAAAQTAGMTMQTSRVDKDMEIVIPLGWKASGHRGGRTMYVKDGRADCRLSIQRVAASSVVYDKVLGRIRNTPEKTGMQEVRHNDDKTLAWWETKSDSARSITYLRRVINSWYLFKMWVPTEDTGDMGLVLHAFMHSATSRV